MTWQQMHDGLFWPRDVLLPGHLDFKDYGSAVRAVEDYNAIQKRRQVLRSQERIPPYRPMKGGWRWPS